MLKKDYEPDVYKLESFEKVNQTLDVKTQYKNFLDENNLDEKNYKDSLKYDNTNIEQNQVNNVSMYDTLRLNSLYDLSFDFTTNISTKEINSNLQKTKAKKQSKADILQDKFLSFKAFLANNVYYRVINLLKGQTRENKGDDNINIGDKYKNISSIENKELGNYIKNMLKNSIEDDKYYTVDRIEDNNIVVLENRETGNTFNYDKNNIPFDICEGDILYYSKGVFEKCDNYRKKLEDDINRRMDNLWN